MVPVSPTEATRPGQWHRLEKAVMGHAALLRSASRVWVGLSGGADSTALLLCLKKSLPQLKLSASHVNHGIQTDSESWAQHCALFCERLQVPLDIARLHPPDSGRFPGGFEAWARRGRYRHWHSLLSEDEVLVLGHHASDQRETVALKLLQGRLPLPMPDSRAIAKALPNGPTLLRPWLGLSGSLIREALGASNEIFIEDPSNQSLALLRNRVRHQLLPGLSKGSSDGWSAALARCGQLTERLVKSVAHLSPPHREGGGELWRLPLAALECPAAVHALLISLVPDISLKRTTGALLELGKSRGSGSKLSPGLTLWRAHQNLVLWRDPQVEPQPLILDGRGRGHLLLEHGELQVCGPAHAPLWLRLPRPGDRLQPDLLKGVQPLDRAKGPLRERLRANRVPRWLRPCYPLVCTEPHQAGQSTPAAAIICVPRYRPVRRLVPGDSETTGFEDGDADNRPVQAWFVEK